MCKRCCSRAVATVDFPDADKPVNQMVKPRWPRNWLRSCRESDGCQVMLLYKPRVNVSQSFYLSWKPRNSSKRRINGRERIWTYVAIVTVRGNCDLEL